MKSKVGEVLGVLAIASTNLELVTKACDRLVPGLDNGDSISLCVGSNETVRKVTLGVLSTACSRHNSPARPHALSALVGNNKSAIVVIVPAVRDHVWAQVSAVSRQYHTFILQRSKKNTQTPLNVNVEKTTDVVVVFPTPKNTGENAENAELLQRLAYIADNIQFCQHLVDMPTNFLNASTYVDECQKVHDRLLATKHVTDAGECRIEIIREDLEVSIGIKLFNR